jgi:hypothetical protein
MSNMLQSRWWVGLDGYELRGQGKRALVRERATSRYREINPSADTDLFRHFSRISTKEEVLTFAAKYGLLGLPRPGLPPAPLSYTPLGVRFFIPSGPRHRSERVSDWLREAEHLACAVMVWESRYEREGSNADATADRGRLLFLASKSFMVPPIDLPPPAVDAMPFTRLFTEDRVSGTRAGRAMRVLLPVITQKLRDLVATPSLEEVARGRAEIVYRPVSLLASIWVQFMLVVTKTKELRRCPACKEMFRVGWTPGRDFGGRRTNARTCSGACRTALSRSRPQGNRRARE